MIPRKLFAEEHEIFRNSVRRFIADELVPHHAEWEKAGVVPRDTRSSSGSR